MVDRVLVSPSGLKVSKPGVSVFSASPYQMIFDSEYQSFQTYSKGTVVLSAASRGTASDGGTQLNPGTGSVVINRTSLAGFLYVLCQEVQSGYSYTPWSSWTGHIYQTSTGKGGGFIQELIVDNGEGWEQGPLQFDSIQFKNYNQFQVTISWVAFSVRIG